MSRRDERATGRGLVLAALVSLAMAAPAWADAGNGATVAGKSMPCARPQAATVAP